MITNLKTGWCKRNMYVAQEWTSDTNVRKADRKGESECHRRQGRRDVRKLSTRPQGMHPDYVNMLILYNAFEHNKCNTLL